MSKDRLSRRLQTSLSLVKPDFYHTWYVGFGVGQELPRFHRFFCETEWSHCFCFAQVGPFVQVVNPGWDRVEIGLRASDEGGPLDAEDYAHELNGQGFTIIRLRHAPTRMKWASVVVPNCVTAVKVICGYNTGIWTQTPRRLFQHMVDRGGAEIVCV